MMTAEIETMERRIVELETRLAFQDDTIEDLNGVIICQQQQLDRLEVELALIRKQFKLLSGASDEAQGGHGY